MGLFAWADEVGSLPQVFMLVLGVVRSLCSVLCDCSSFYFLPKKERRLQISYKLAAIYQMISRSSVRYKEARLGKQDQDRAPTLVQIMFPLSSVSSNGHVYFICTDAWTVTHVHYMHNIVYARTWIIVFSVPMKYLHWIRFGCRSVVELALYKDLGLIPSNRN